MTDKVLDGRVTLVTGASRGIGYQAALALAKAGSHIIATARTQGGLEDLDDAIKAEGGDTCPNGSQKWRRHRPTWENHS